MAIDALAYLEEAATPAPKATSGSFAPFFFAIGDGEKALIRPLLNLVTDGKVGLVEVLKHEAWDNSKGIYVYRNMCAKALDQECALCAEVEQLPESTKVEKDFKRQAIASRRFVIPVYLHTVVNMKTNQQVTYTNQAGETFPVSGPRLLEMKPDSSTIFRDLLKTYQASENHDITSRDFKIERRGIKKDTKYDTTPKDVSPFTIDVPLEYQDKDLVFSLYMEACPPKVIGEESVTPASAAKQGAIAAAPDF